MVQPNKDPINTEHYDYCHCYYCQVAPLQEPWEILPRRLDSPRHSEGWIELFGSDIKGEGEPGRLENRDSLVITAVVSTIISLSWTIC